MTTEHKPTKEPRYILALHPGGGKLSDADVIDKVRDELADMDEVELDDVKIIRTLNVPADDQIYVFNVELITELAR